MSGAPNNMVVLAFADAAALGESMAAHMDAALSYIDVHHFPDGESLVTLPPKLPPVAVIVRSLNNPDHKLVELYLAAATAREMGCTHLILVAPYLCYMRQDKAFQPGQAVSQKLIGELVSTWVDDLITVDPHLHRVASLDPVYRHCRTRTLSAAPLLGQYLRGRRDIAVIGPDQESRQWVEQVAAQCGAAPLVARKERFGDREVRVTLPKADLAGRHVYLVDDVISSGQTMVEAGRLLRARGAASVNALCTHALFAPGAREAMSAAGFTDIISTNAIDHETSHIDLAPLLADAVIAAVRTIASA